MSWGGKPAIRFLSWFLGIYLAGNLGYGIYVEGCKPLPDIFTKAISFQTSWSLNLLGEATNVLPNIDAPTVLLKEGQITILRIYEGCNGVNVLIVFAAFVVAFGGKPRHIMVFILIGMVVLNFANLLRIGMLYWVAKNYQSYFYYVHKYVFTIALYFVVLCLWAIWVYRYVRQQPKTDAPA